MANIELVVLAQPYQAPSSAAELINRAVALSKSGNNEQAIVMLRQALCIDPNCAAAHVDLAAAFTALKRPEEAMHECEIAIQLEPLEEKAYLNYVSAATIANHLSDALRIGQEYLWRFPQGFAHRQMTDEMASIKRNIKLRETEDGISAPAGAPDNYLFLVTANGKQRWALQTMPIKVFIYPGQNCQGYTPVFTNIMIYSFQLWQQATHGFIRFIPVTDPHEADIECRWTDRAKDLKSPTEGGEALCRSRNGWIEKVKITILTYKPNEVVSTNLVFATCLHEIGHGLGLQGHSDSSRDIMYAWVNSNIEHVQLSQRDVNTLYFLYH